MDKDSNSSTKDTSLAPENLYKNKLVIKGITLILNEIIEENFNQEKKKQSQDKKGSIRNSKVDMPVVEKANSFSVKKIPGIAIDAYIERILKYSNIDESTLTIALIYIDRLCEITKIQMSMNNIHRLIITSVLLAIKYNEDDYYSNTHYAKVGGITLQEINTLEEEFVEGLDWKVFVDKSLFDKYYSYLKHYQGLVKNNAK